MNKYNEIRRAIETVAALRDPESGCPWDLEQTHESLLRFLIEETYEFIDATDEKDPEKMKDELGDVLLQVLLHSTIAEQDGKFNLEDVAKNLADKIIRRHPHVFKNKNNNISIEEVKTNWEKIKKEEKNKSNESLIGKELLNFPSLFSAYKIGQKTNKIGFDWDGVYQVSYKVEEEWQELKEELTPHRKPNPERIEEEMGDLLFSMAQLVRHAGLNPEEVLRKANKKFLRRFQAMEEVIKRENRDLKEMDQNEMDEFWTIVKKEEKQL